MLVGSGSALGGLVLLFFPLVLALRLGILRCGSLPGCHRLYSLAPAQLCLWLFASSKDSALLTALCYFPLVGRACVRVSDLSRATVPSGKVSG